MSALQPDLPGSRVLDLFAGSGALGLEALSRGAREVVFVERSGRAVAVLRRNVEALGAEAEVRIVRRDAFAYLERLASTASLPFDLALADPPYGTGAASRLARLFLQRPFAAQLWLEHRVDEELPEVGADHRRRYGETVLTTYSDPRGAGES